MAETLKQDEALPASYPATPSGLSPAAAAIAAGSIWARIEAYASTRWSSRAVVWTVEGPGDWEPLLTPATVSSIEEWTGTGWQAATPDASPLGGYCLDAKTYRITATVGGGPVPEAVNQAFCRLAEYTSDAGAPGSTKGRSGASSGTLDLGDYKTSFNRAPTWLARAMINSGAADLLRPYRRNA